MEPGLQCTIFPATVAVVLGPVQPHYFWEPNSHGPRNRRASSAFLALFPGIVSFVTSRAAFQPVNVCAGRSKFPVFSFRKGNLKFRMQPLFFFLPQITSFSLLFLPFFFVLCFDIAYIVVTALHLFFLNPDMLGNFKIMPCKWFWETTLVLQLKCNYFSAVFQKYLSEANLIFISSTLLHN